MTNMMIIKTMNRIAQLTIALSVLFCTVSCNDKIEADFPAAQDYITVTSQVGPMVKAGYEASDLPSTFYMSITGIQSPFNGTMTRTSTSSNTYSFPTGQNPTWGTDANVANVYVKAVASGSDTYYNRSNGTVTVPTDQSSANNVKTADMLGASTDDGIVISDNNVNITFSHLMSKMLLKYTKPSSVTVNSIQLVNICTKGTYSYTNMAHSYASTPATGTITMYHSNNSAEAIFFPYDPKNDTSTLQLSVSIKINNQNKTITCPITLKDDAKFEPGKCYMMNVAISGTTLNAAEVEIVGWDSANTGIQVAGERVLWIGTSIPAGSLETGVRSYPYLVDDAMNCEVINNAVGGSLVLKYTDADPKVLIEQVTKKGNNEYDANGNPTKLGWDDPTSALHCLLGGLSRKREEAEEYRPYLTTISGGDAAWVEKWINAIKDLSYETLILPYIDGSEGYPQCTTIILDHGYNDRNCMFYEAGAYSNPDEQALLFRGYGFLLGLKNGTIKYPDYIQFIKDCNVKDSNLSLERSYIYQMCTLIEKIKAENPDVRIIIGNYFTANNPVVAAAWKGAIPDYDKLIRVLCYNNEAIAGICGLDIVNVYKYLWMDDAMFYEYCPDLTHPFNPVALQAIADIYIRELDGVIGSRVK